MLEKYQKMLEQAKSKQTENDCFLTNMNLSFVQNLFEMLDVNKWLKFNVTNKKQLEQIEKRDSSIKVVLKKLCVPSYQQENT